MSGARVIFVNRRFWPDESAASQLLADLVSRLGTDFEVTVVASRCGLDRHMRESWQGARIVRVWSTRPGARSLPGRFFDFLSFFVSLGCFLLARVADGDIVVLKTDPPLLQLLNTSLVRAKGGVVINWLQDLYPEIAVRLGVFPGPGWMSAGIARWRDRALRAATTNVVVGEGMYRYVQDRGVNNCVHIPNWANETAITPVQHEQNPLREKWGLAGRFVVMYSGNFGRAHRFSEISGAVIRLSADPEIRFVFIGDGAGLSPMRARLEAAEVGNCLFLPAQPQSRLRYSLGAADLHLVSLQPGMEDLLMPSKVYGILAAGRALAFVGEPDGPIARFIRKEDVGFVAGFDDEQALSRGIARLKRHSDLRARQQANARTVFEARYTRAAAIDRWRQVLGGGSRPPLIGGSTGDVAEDIKKSITFQ